MRGSAEDFIEELVDRIAARVAERILHATVALPRTPQPEYLSTKQAATLLGLGRSTLECWRGHGRGPKFIKLPGAGGVVRYSRSDLEGWLARYSR